MYSTPDRAQSVKQCLTCGADFTPPPNRPGKKFCSDSCRNKHCNLVGSPHQYTCEWCCKVYRAKRKDRNHFCSRECAYAYLEEHGRPEQRKPDPQPEPMPLCLVCGKPCGRRKAKTCSADCRAERARRDARRYAIAKSQRDRTPRPCRECGMLFAPEYGNMRRVFCSTACSRRYAKRKQRSGQGSFNGFARQRLRRVYGDDWRSHYEPVNKRKVFQRDGWRCQLCGCKVKQSKQWTRNQATVDHIVPISLGGEHSYANVQTACWACNTRKGATVEGQMRLIG
jgi:5-methylcytosine-specific restriction endonuclease McrA